MPSDPTVTRNGGCPSEDELEFWVLTSRAQALPTDRLADHVTLCPACLARFADLLDYYGILATELDKPAAKAVRRFVHRLLDPTPSKVKAT